ncbi:MAG: hypothetical protein ACFFAN_05885 [Promethearchaeota archaeon]
MKGIVGKQYASNNKAITTSYLAKSVMGLESQIPDIVEENTSPNDGK